MRCGEHFDLPGMRILQFAFGGAQEDRFLPHHYEHHTVVYTGTHDNDTTVGWYENLTDERASAFRAAMRPARRRDPAWGLIRLAWASVADLAIAPLQDVLRLGNEARMNLPGTHRRQLAVARRSGPPHRRPLRATRRSDQHLSTRSERRSKHTSPKRQRGIHAFHLIRRRPLACALRLVTLVMCSQRAYKSAIERGPLMKFSRRSFLATSCATAAAWPLAIAHTAEHKRLAKAELNRILDEPVLKTDFLKAPVTVASVELLKNGRNYLLRTRSTDGVEAITVPNPARMVQTYPIFLKDIVPGVPQAGRPRAGVAPLGRLSPQQQLQAARHRPVGRRRGDRDGAARADGPDGQAARRRFLRRQAAQRHRRLLRQRRPRQHARRRKSTTCKSSSPTPARRRSSSASAAG